MRRAGQRTARAAPASASSVRLDPIRMAIAGIAVGLGVGSIGTLLLISDDEEQRHVSRTVAEVTVSKPGEVLRHEALRYGLPSENNVMVRAGYVVSYDNRTRNPAWVMEHISKEMLQVLEDTDRSKSQFTVDVATPEPFRVHPNQFIKSGYDKGHLAPARDMTTSQSAMNESFLMTNISPQVGVGFNRGYWSRLEGFVRHLAFQFDAVYVVTGPLFLPKRKKKTDEFHVSYPVLGSPPDVIAVPTHFFKVVLVRKQDGSYLTAGFILPNQAIPEKKNLVDFLTPIDVIQKYSGLLFFNKLQGARTLELCKEVKCSLAVAYKRAASEKPPAIASS